MSVHNFELRLEERLRRKAFAHYDCYSMIVDFGCPSRYRVLQERRNTTTGASAASLVTTSTPSNNYNAQDMNSNHPSLAHNNNNNHHNHNNTNGNGYNNITDDKHVLNNSNGYNQNNNNHTVIVANEHINGNSNGSNKMNPDHSDFLKQQLPIAPPDLGDGRQNDLVLACPFFRNELGGEEERIICLNKLTDRRLNTSSINELHKPSFISGISIVEFAQQDYRNICPYQKNFLLNPVIDYADTGAFYYRRYFFGKDHQNWFGKSESYGPLAISIRKEQIFSSYNYNNDPKYQYRIILRTSELAVLRGTINEECIPNSTHRTGSKEVLEYLLAKSDIPLTKLRLGTPNAEAQILKLDEHKQTKNYKVGVLYCRAGQSTEEDFYNNEHSGPLFDEFLSCLGENVRLMGFDRYRGGLDNKSDSTGLYSVYATYEDCEIMFHVSTMLPFSENNRQQLSRKRHIGNDIVTILFQEEGALPFTPKAFRSQFQHVFIIVRALNQPQLPDGSYDYNAPRRYAISVSRSHEMPPFGPQIPEEGVFVKSHQFTNFLLAKIINAENAAHKYCEKFQLMDQRTRLGLLTDLADDYVTTTTLNDVSSGSNSGSSGAAKIVSSLFGKKRSQRRYANFCGHSDIKGAIVWDVQVKDFGQSNKIIDCILGISASYVIIIEQQTKETLYVAPVEAILGWTSNPAWIKIFGHQAECLLVQIKDPDVDEICEIVTRLKAVTNGCETRELTLRRTFLKNPLGFHIQPEGIVTKVDAGSVAWQAHLLPGSRLVEICKTATASLSYSQIMEYMKTSSVVTLTVLPPNQDGSFRRGCLSANCAHQPIVSRPPSTFSSASAHTHFSKPKRRIPTSSLMTLV